MANKVLVRAMNGTPKQICFANHGGDFAPDGQTDLRITTDGSQETDCQLDLTSLANGSYAQSDKVDLGDPRAAAYKVRAALEFAATPTAGNTLEFYWAPSHKSTADPADGNPGNVSGTDSGYTGYSSNADASVKQLDYIGTFTVTAQATATIQVAEVGILCPTERYGSLVVKNGSGAAMHSDAVEMSVVFDPIVDEIQ